IQANAEADLKMHENKFIEWVRTVQPQAVEFNPASIQQLTQLLFGPCYKKQNKKFAEKINKIAQKKQNAENGIIDEDIEDISPEESSIENDAKENLTEILPAVREF